MRDELLNEILGFGLDDAFQSIAALIESDDTTRQHSSLADQMLAAFATSFAATGQGFKRCWMKVQWQAKVRRNFPRKDV